VRKISGAVIAMNDNNMPLSPEAAAGQIARRDGAGDWRRLPPDLQGDTRVALRVSAGVRRRRREIAGFCPKLTDALREADKPFWRP
jgi:hypothetical protein